MSFSSWIIWYTGLSLYDFRVLDVDGTSEKEVRSLFGLWVKDLRPSKETTLKAIDDMEREGFAI